MLPIEIVVSLLVNTPVDELYDIYASDSRKIEIISGVSRWKVRGLLYSRELIRQLSEKHRVTVYRTFGEFLDAYDRRYMFRDSTTEYFGLRWRCN